MTRPSDLFPNPRSAGAEPTAIDWGAVPPAPDPVERPRTYAVASLLIVFVFALGILVGSCGSNLFAGSPQPTPRLVVDVTGGVECRWIEAADGSVAPLGCVRAQP
jgi:hypothetical protein